MIHHALTLTLAVSFPALAQEMQEKTALAELPTYVDGEHYEGSFWSSDNGVLLDFVQEAQRGSDGKIYIHQKLFSEGRMVYSDISDPNGWMLSAEGAEGNLIVLSTTCSRSNLFPIFLNKEYTCTSVVEENGETFTLRESFTFNEEFRNVEGELTHYCALATFRDAKIAGSARVCYTPDGKWVQSLELLETQESVKI